MSESLAYLLLLFTERGFLRSIGIGKTLVKLKLTQGDFFEGRTLALFAQVVYSVIARDSKEPAANCPRLCRIGCSPPPDAEECFLEKFFHHLMVADHLVYQRIQPFRIALVEALQRPGSPFRNSAEQVLVAFTGE